MCGIAGYFDKSSNSAGPIGSTVLGMLTALGCRGPDSAGVALYRSPSDADLLLQIKVGENDHSRQGAEQVIEKASALSKPKDVSTTGAYLRLTMDGTLDPGPLAAAVESAGPDVEVVSMGRSLEIVKQVGSPDRLEDTFHISNFKGSHGIGHTRMSTESKVDLSHSQPFWAHGSPDLAIVHNGHITNYHKLRRQYEQHGVRFYSENDSEIIAVYVARGMSRGLSLEEVLQAALVDWDGSFSCLVSTADAMGFVKDPFAHKPLLFGETDEFAVVATEEIAFRPAFGSDFRVSEAGAREVKVWRN
jgi:glutamate synthase domain-containing protein 1